MISRHAAIYGITFAMMLVVASSSHGQRETAGTLKSNPYRDIGGSCVLGKNGEVLYAPKGSKCQDRVDHLAEARKGAGTSEQFGDLPPGFHPEASGLVSDHAHIANELAEVRRAIARNQKDEALALADKLIGELTDHLVREEKFIGKLAAEHRTH